MADRTRGTCSIEGCGRQHQARGWCYRHWRLWKQFGDPMRPSKTCAECGTAFEPVLHGSPRYCSDECRVTRRRRLATASSWRSRLRTRYGIEAADYEAMLDAQDGGCAICGATTPGGVGTFHVDHCHDTGAVRGLLCSACNIGIGNLGDSAERLLIAADYLTRPPAVIVAKKPQPSARCSATRLDGEPCTRWAAMGGAVCAAHRPGGVRGGAAADV